MKKDTPYTAIELHYSSDIAKLARELNSVLREADTAFLTKKKINLFETAKNIETDLWDKVHKTYGTDSTYEEELITHDSHKNTPRQFYYFRKV